MIDWRKTLVSGTGWLALAGLAANVLSGIPLVWSYAPDPSTAWASIVDLTAAAPLGRLTRSLHHFSSHLLLAASALHLALVIVLKSIGSVEQKKWVSGAFAFVPLVAVPFIGEILPWDGHGGVSLTVAGSLLGPLVSLLGGEGHRLVRLLILHVAGAAVVAGALLAHVELKKNGVKGEGTAPGVSHEWALPAAGAVALAALAFAFDAPLGPRFDDVASPAGVSAEWYSRWLQSLAVWSPWAARAGGATLVALVFATPGLARAAGQRTVKTIWLAVITGMAALSVWC